ncbi:HTH-type transcriptional activator RhaR [compost metagenome]
MTPSDFVRSLRIRKAAGLLLDTDLTLNQIASRCGFENGFYLSRVFAQSMGMSPSKYRELNRV